MLLANTLLRIQYFLETATGRAQWEPPAGGVEGSPAPTSSPPPQHGGHTKRRQYAAGQTQAYYSSTDGLAPPPSFAGGPGSQLQAPAAGGQLFTPGLAAENQFASQQQQPGGASSYYGQQPEPDYINSQQAYGQQPSMGYGQPQPNMGALTDQFGQMGVGGQKPFQVYTTNLLTAPPDPIELSRPPPEIRLPPNASISPSPHANASHLYQRSTLNAIPTTSSLLGKSKIPLGLVLNPYRSVKEGEEPVPVVTDTVIARCRRCRTYINPYVQFIDGGNR